MGRFYAAIVTFFSGAAMVCALLLLVYVIAAVADRLPCFAQRDALSEEELEERRHASITTRMSGLAGLLKEERNRIFHSFFEKSAFPYHNDVYLAATVKGTQGDIETQESLSAEINRGGSEKRGKDSSSTSVNATDEPSIDDEDANAVCCSICLVEYAEGDKVILGPTCSHLFHYDCCMQWLDKGNDHCPYCREQLISAEQFHETALEVVGEERVAKLKKINQIASVRVAQLSTTNGTQTVDTTTVQVGSTAPQNAAEEVEIASPRQVPTNSEEEVAA